MARRSTLTLGRQRDGISQKGRRLAALDPAYARIDERNTADLLRFVQRFSERVRYFDVDPSSGALRDGGTWAQLAQGGLVSVDDVLSFIGDPARFEGERGDWLRRPHFTLLLTFLELLGDARDQVNGLTQRHLDHYYDEVLGLAREVASPDRAAVLFTPSAGAVDTLLPAGAELQAGADATGRPLVYRTERALVVNQARVAAVRSLYVDRRRVGIAGPRQDRSLTATEALDASLRIALGQPRAGDPLPGWGAENAVVDAAFLRSLAPVVALAQREGNLFIDHHELRSMMRLVRRRNDSDAEWDEINRLMGVVEPVDRHAFLANLESRVGPLDFSTDGLAQVSNVDDLYTYRFEPEVTAYIGSKLAAVGFDAFVAMMQIKLRIDAEWREINRILERAGRRKRSLLSWSLPEATEATGASFDPTAFDVNLALALDDAWPQPWPFGAEGIVAHDELLRALERHLSMAVERVATLVAFAERVAGSPDALAFDWEPIDRLLADAHAEQARAARRDRLSGIRGDDATAAGFDAAASFAVSGRSTLSWAESGKLRAHLDARQLELLVRFRNDLGDPAAPRVFGWEDACALLETAERGLQGIDEPAAERVEWRNLHAFDDARAVLADPATSARWKTFGEAPHTSHAGATIGWALRSPVLAASQGERSLTVTFGLDAESFDRIAFLRALGLTPEEADGVALLGAVNGALVAEVSTAKGWVPLRMEAAHLAVGTPGDDYWSLAGTDRNTDVDRPALQIELRAEVTVDAIAPLAGSTDAAPTLRVTLRQHPAEGGSRTSLEPFEPLALAAVHVRLQVAGLRTLALQQEDARLDPKKPFEPFGASPTVGARLYISHPELVQNRLEQLSFDLQWMGLPDALVAHYTNYGLVSDAASFQVSLTLVDRALELALGSASLFDAGQAPAAKHSIELEDVPGVIARTAPGWSYQRRPTLVPGDDLRDDGRYLRWELAPLHFGHPTHAAVAATAARKLAVALAKGGADATNAEYAVQAPYTPKLKELLVAYRTSLEVEPGDDGDDELLHVHPFGTSLVLAASPSLLPRYDGSGELYIGLEGLQRLQAPQRVTLLLQLAEGTGAADVPPPAVSWSVLDRRGWLPLGQGELVSDGTRGLLNSGIVEILAPAVTPGDLLGPGDLYWLRASVARDAAAACDSVGVHAQAITAVFDDRGNAPSHWDQPLAPGSIDRLVEADPRIAEVHQPYSSFGGRAPEEEARRHLRLSERLRHKRRALSPWDHERLVLQRFPQLHKAKCLRAGTPGAGTGQLGDVDLIVIPDVREVKPSDPLAPRAPANVLADIEAWLRGRAPPDATVRARNARYVQVQVRVAVRFRAGVDVAVARRRLGDDLVRFLSPWAFDDGAELTIGGRIYANSIVDFLDRREYVDWVAEIQLARSLDGEHWEVVKQSDPEQSGGYHVAAAGPDEVLVSARQHTFEVIADDVYQPSSFTGIGYARLELDFIVG